MPDFDLESAMMNPLPEINGVHCLPPGGVEVVNSVMQALVSKFEARLKQPRVWKVQAGVRVEITYHFLNYGAYGGIEKLLDDLMETVYGCQVVERQIRNLKVDWSSVTFYLYH